MADFDPAKHPRNTRGEFSSILDKLEKGASVHLPDGTKVTREQHGFAVHTPGGGKGREAPLAQHAADHALTASAKSTHPASLGGAKSHASLPAALKVNRARARRAEKSGKPRDTSPPTRLPSASRRVSDVINNPSARPRVTNPRTDAETRQRVSSDAARRVQARKAAQAGHQREIQALSPSQKRTYDRAVEQGANHDKALRNAVAAVGARAPRSPEDQKVLKNALARTTVRPPVEAGKAREIAALSPSQRSKYDERVGLGDSHDRALRTAVAAAGGRSSKSPEDQRVLREALGRTTIKPVSEFDVHKDYKAGDVYRKTMPELGETHFYEVTGKDAKGKTLIRRVTSEYAGAHPSKRPGIEAAHKASSKPVVPEAARARATATKDLGNAEHIFAGMPGEKGAHARGEHMEHRLEQAHPDLSPAQLRKMAKEHTRRANKLREKQNREGQPFHNTPEHTAQDRALHHAELASAMHRQAARRTSVDEAKRAADEAHAEYMANIKKGNTRGRGKSLQTAVNHRYAQEGLLNGRSLTQAQDEGQQREKLDPNVREALDALSSKNARPAPEVLGRAATPSAPAQARTGSPSGTGAALQKDIAFNEGKSNRDTYDDGYHTALTEMHAAHQAGGDAGLRKHISDKLGQKWNAGAFTDGQRSALQDYQKRVGGPAVKPATPKEFPGGFKHVTEIPDGTKVEHTDSVPVKTKAPLLSKIKDRSGRQGKFERKGSPLFNAGADMHVRGVRYTDAKGKQHHYYEVHKKPSADESLSRHPLQPDEAQKHLHNVPPLPGAGGSGGGGREIRGHAASGGTRLDHLGQLQPGDSIPWGKEGARTKVVSNETGVIKVANPDAGTVRGNRNRGASTQQFTDESKRLSALTGIPHNSTRGPERKGPGLPAPKTGKQATSASHRSASSVGQHTQPTGKAPASTATASSAGEVAKVRKDVKGDYIVHVGNQHAGTITKRKTSFSRQGSGTTGFVARPADGSGNLKGPQHGGTFPTREDAAKALVAHHRKRGQSARG